jgi:hypothetical protein
VSINYKTAGASDNFKSTTSCSNPELFRTTKKSRQTVPLIYVNSGGDEVRDGSRNNHNWARNLKNVAQQKQSAICKKERNTLNAIMLLNYLKCIAPQQLMLRMQVFTKIFYSTKNATATLLNKKYIK